jgi:signal transduction histidine kinase
MSTGDLRERVDARDHLADAAETVGRRFEQEALAALSAGDPSEAEAAVRRGARSVESLAETLRVYQAELHAQADELQAAQARTEVALARFTALFGHLPLAALLVDEHGEVVDRNVLAATLFALGAHGRGRRFLHRLVDVGAYQERVRPAFHEARAVGAARCDDVDFVTADGHRFCGELHNAVLPPEAGDGRLGATFACIVVDRTAQRERARLLAAAQAAEAGSRAKTQFLSRMSHELRTPLNAILGFAQLMRLEADNGDLTLKPHRLHFFETAARHLLELINEVLDVSAIEAGQMRLRIEPLALAPLIGECLPIVTPAAAAARVKIGLDPALQPGAPASPVVRADALRLKQVLINLLSNAVKYNRPSGHVHVEAHDDGAQVRIAVRDTGVGLTADRQAELFQPFSRAGAESTTVEGSGMGLYVCRRFVELMCGSIDVESTPQVGSTFTVTLPAGTAAGA